MIRHQARDYILNNPAQYYWEDDKTPLSDNEVNNLIDDNDTFDMYLETGTVITHDEAMAWAEAVDTEVDPDAFRD
ncbi:hypothetical protein [Klebsiella pneumoniae]|uniref:hypothetical protein n=1 Tax=Klebsiella pneumoniae TaxID=573 RepID=UPI001E491119|nr:hypothetical protein [Klebsiella pneumoniae]MCC5747440.1 hypothetical protein [Klebsiella pneumoniae]